MLVRERNHGAGKWEYLRTSNLVEAVHKAKDLGWAENKVQVKEMQVGIDEFIYFVEPYENCGCPSLMKYEDYFIHESSPREPVSDG